MARIYRSTKNIPVRFIFDNKILYAIAHKNPKSLNSFDSEDLKNLNLG